MSAATIPVPLSILDLAQVGPGETVREALDHSAELARFADSTGYRRIWYAEHHNMSAIASSAPAVLIAHMADQTQRIRLGAGGVMLPNHSPLTIAEQFGTLAELHPGRIDLGLGRAPGGDSATFQALRRTPASAENFPTDVVELSRYFDGRSPVGGVRATPGGGTRVPLYILGSSLFGARLAAMLGLPYAFASHFAPAALEEAIAVYRNESTPSGGDGALTEPYLMVAAGVIADPDAARAADEFHRAQVHRIKLLYGRDRLLTDAEAELALEGAPGRQVAESLRYAAVGTPDQVRDRLTGFVERTGADELIIAALALDRSVWLDSMTLLAPDPSEVN